MKQITKHDVGQALSDRWWVGLALLCILVTIGGLISMAITIQPRETQVIVQYSNFGTTGFYRHYWYHLWGYGALLVIATVSHILISLKLRHLERRALALALLWGTLGMLVVIILFAHMVIRIAALG